MRKNGKRLVLSVGAVLTALCITAGVTMAWFHDTEPLAANFSAGKLDITVTPDQAEPGEQKIDFENLRPMTEEAFAEELAEADGNIVNANTEGYSPVPVYFHPVTVRNEGTLPAQVLFQMVDDGPDGKVDVDEITVENVTVNGQVYGEKVTQTGEQVTCDASNYILKDKLKIFVYQKNSEGNWEKVPNVNLNEASLEEGETAAFQPFTSEEPLPAGSENEEQFLIAGYLPEDAGNAMASVAAASYTVQFREGRGPAFDMAAALPDFLSRDAILIQKETKKGCREVDLRPGIYEMECRESGVYLLLDASSGSNIKPAQVLAAFLGQNGCTLQENALLINREEIFTNTGTAQKPVFVPLYVMGDDEICQTES